MSIIHIILFIFILAHSFSIYKSLQMGVFSSRYGERMEIRKSEGKLSFYIALVFHLFIWLILNFLFWSWFIELVLE